MASIGPKALRLKDGRMVTLRTPVGAAAAAVLAHARLNMEGNTGSVTTPEEFTITLDEEVSWLR